VIVLFARAFGVLLFGGALAAKLRDVPRFIAAIERYRLLPTNSVAPVAATLLAAEAAATLSLATGQSQAIGAAIAIGLLLLFAAAIAINLLRGVRDIDCGCSLSALPEPLEPVLVVRNLLLCVAIAPALLAQPPTGSAIVYVDAIGAALACATLNIVIATLVSLRGPAAALQRRFS
jgi:hypothetical protein